MVTIYGLHDGDVVFEDTWARILERTTAVGECWMWQGARTGTGYGAIRFRGRVVPVHRIAVLASGRAIPKGMDVDHGCHTRECTPERPEECPHRLCVNPKHLEVLSHADNVRRRWEDGTCPQGHPLKDRGDGYRVCVECRKVRVRARYARLRANGGAR